jgi:hypothetical protein
MTAKAYLLTGIAMLFFMVFSCSNNLKQVIDIDIDDKTDGEDKRTIPQGFFLDDFNADNGGFAIRYTDVGGENMLTSFTIYFWNNKNNYEACREDFLLDAKKQDGNSYLVINTNRAEQGSYEIVHHEDYNYIFDVKNLATVWYCNTYDSSPGYIEDCYRAYSGELKVKGDIPLTVEEWNNELPLIEIEIKAEFAIDDIRLIGCSTTGTFESGETNTTCECRDKDGKVSYCEPEYGSDNCCKNPESNMAKYHLKWEVFGCKHYCATNSLLDGVLCSPLESYGEDYYPEGALDSGEGKEEKEESDLSSCSENNKFCHSRDGLQWSDISKDKMTWEKGVDYCNNFGGRLPSISELRTLVKDCSVTETGGKCGVTDSCPESTCWSFDACRGCYFDPNGRYSLFGDTVWLWSSTVPPDDPVYKGEAEFAWALNFLEGKMFYQPQSSERYVRCVE